MRIDLYTKVCLTVISLSLGVIAFKDFSPVKPAWASNHVVHKIAICDDKGKSCAPVNSGYGLYTYSP